MSFRPSRENFRMLAKGLLEEISTTKELLGKMTYNPEELRKSLGNEITAKMDRLAELEFELSTLSEEDSPQTQVGQGPRNSLADEIRQQKELLIAKFGFMDDVRQERSAQPEDGRVQQPVVGGGRRPSDRRGHHQDRPRTGSPSATTAIAQLTTLARRRSSPRRSRTTRTRRRPAHDPDSTTRQPPATRGKTDAMTYPRKRPRESRHARDEQSSSWSIRPSLSSARRRALNSKPGLGADRAVNMVVTQDGVTRTYRSNIIPAPRSVARFARSYAQHNSDGISSATKTDLDHARNRKVSELQRLTPNPN